MTQIHSNQYIALKNALESYKGTISPDIDSATWEVEEVVVRFSLELFGIESVLVECTVNFRWVGIYRVKLNSSLRSQLEVNPFIEGDTVLAKLQNLILAVQTKQIS